MTTQLHRSPDPTPPETLSATRWYGALEHRRINGPTPWVVQVLGMHEDRGMLWIQLARDADPADSLVLQVPPNASVDAAVLALEAYSTADQEFPRVISL